MCVCVYVDVYIYANYIYNYDKSILNNHSPWAKIDLRGATNLNRDFLQGLTPKGPASGKHTSQIQITNAQSCNINKFLRKVQEIYKDFTSCKQGLDAVSIHHS